MPKSTADNVARLVYGISPKERRNNDATDKLLRRCAASIVRMDDRILAIRHSLVAKVNRLQQH